MRLRISVFACLWLAGCGAALATPYKQVRDFEVVCTAGLTCDIQTATTDSGDPNVSAFTFERKAGRNTPLDLKLYASQQLKAGSELRFSVDGKQALVLPLSRLTYDSDNWQYLFPGGAETRALLDAMRNGSRLRVEYTGDKGAATTNFSLSGLVGSLIFADEVQGRLEATDALQVKGNKQSRRPRVRDIATMSEIPKPIRAQFTAPDGACSVSDETYFNDMGGFEADIGNGYKLWSLPCGDSAYNQDVVFFTALNKDYQPLPLPVLEESGLTTTRYAVNIDWDQASKTLTSFYKGRGLGDCGEWDKWVLKSSEEGPAFVLVEARAKECDESNPSADDAEEPDKWPLVWPVRAK